MNKKTQNLFKLHEYDLCMTFVFFLFIYISTHTFKVGISYVYITLFIANKSACCF